MPRPVAGVVAEQDRHVCPAKERAEFAAESEMAVEVAGWALPGPAGRDAPQCGACGGGDEYDYVLHSVLVHVGDSNMGHYYAFINDITPLAEVPR